MLLQSFRCNLLIRNSSFCYQYFKHSTYKTAFSNRNMSSNENSSKIRKTIIAVAQMCATSNKNENLQTVRNLVCDAKNQKVDFLFFPECCDYVGENQKQTLNLSEPLTGSTVKEYCSLAKTHNIWLSFGGIHEKVENECEEKINNTHIVINSNGEIVGVYRKLHLFDVDTPNFRFRESAVVSPGKQLIAPISTPSGLLGMQICYDVRFVESSLLLRQLGAEILAYPSAFAFTTGQAHWETLLRARAIEMQCFVVAAAQTGFHNKKRQSWGHAMIVDPWGKILCEIEDQNYIGIAVSEIDLSYVDSIKNILPVFEHRRNDIYSLTGSSIVNSNVEIFQDRNFATENISKDTIFLESQFCYAFTNLRCVIEGHVLIATKRIIPRVKDLNLNEMTDLFVNACKIQSMLEDIYKATAATLTIQDGSDAGQTIPHVHMHIMPRYLNDFRYNDQIYTKLEDLCIDKPPRSIEDRINEAVIYRKYLSAQ